MRSFTRAPISRHRRGGTEVGRIPSGMKTHLNSAGAQEALRELARCFARAAVAAMFDELESRQLTKPDVPEAQEVARNLDPPRPALPEKGFLGLRDIVGDKRRGLRGIIPVSPATWYGWIAKRRAPKPVKLGSRSVWRVEDVRALIERLSAGIPLDPL